MHQLIAGKYFNNKGEVVEGFNQLISVANKAQNVEFVNAYAGDTCYKQIEKNLTGGAFAFKNVMLNSLLSILKKSRAIKPEVKSALYELLFRDTRHCLQKVSEKASMIESMDEFEEKREEEKDTLQSVLYEYDCLPYLLPQGESIEQK